MATGEPVLWPPLIHSCPNESVTFTCSDSNVTIIEWRVEPHHSRDDELSYSVSLISVNDTGPLTRNCTNNTFCSQLSHFSRLDDRFANMTITLSVRAPSVTNGTNIKCVTFVGNVKNTVNGTIFFSG